MQSQPIDHTTPNSSISDEEEQYLIYRMENPPYDEDPYTGLDYIDPFDDDGID
jgi:hypothetical protein